MAKTIVVNGKPYDKKTGLATKQPAGVLPESAPKKIVAKKKITVSTDDAPVSSTTKAAHKPMKSQTLNRRAVKKPPQKPRRTLTAPVKPKPQRNVPRIATKPSPIIPHGSSSQRRPTAVAPQTTNSSESEQKHRISKKPVVITSSVVVALIAICVLVYLFVPAVSTWMAANRAGVNAKLPAYAPTDYAVNGTVESSPGLVTINYKSRNAGTTYSLAEQNSNWDSNGVLENKVKPFTGNYQTLSQKGLTIFRFEDKAIWVNGGILYTISDGKNLSNEQILKIVDSI